MTEELQTLFHKNELKTEKRLNLLISVRVLHILVNFCRWTLWGQSNMLFGGNKQAANLDEFSMDS